MEPYKIKIGKKLELLISDFRILIESEYIFDSFNSKVTFDDKNLSNTNNVPHNKKDQKVKIKISVVDKRDLLNKLKRYDFTQSKEIIKVGRDSELLDICLKNEEVSNLHCTISFDKSKGTWVIKDGNGSKLSSNGTWVLIQEYYEIPKDKYTYFRFENKVFMAYYENEI